MVKLPKLCINLKEEMKTANIEGERLFQALTHDGKVIISTEEGIEGAINLGECIVIGEYVIFAIEIPIINVTRTRVDGKIIYIED